MQIERSAVCPSDRRDDREPQPAAILRAGPWRAQPAERFGELIDIVLREQLPPFSTTRLASAPLTAGVMRTQPPGWLWVIAFSITFSTIRDSSVSLPLTHASADTSRSTLSCFAEISDVRRATAWEAIWSSATVRSSPSGRVLAAGEREQALQQPLDAIELLAEPPLEGEDVLGNRDRLGHRDIERGAHRRQRGAQLVRCVGGESPLRLERRLEPLQQPVDRVGELSELIVRPGSASR